MFGKIREFVAGFKTYIILGGALLTAFPGWVESVPEGTGVITMIGSLFETFWPIFAGLTIKAGLNRTANGG